MDETAKNMTAPDESRLTPSEETKSLMSVPSLPQWRESPPRRSLRHKISIPFENASQRGLNLLDALNESSESVVASDEKRWQEWVKREEVSSQNSGRIQEDENTPPTSGVRRPPLNPHIFTPKFK